MINSIRPILAAVTQPVVNLYQSLAQPLGQSSLFQSTYSLVSNGFQNIRDIFINVGNKISQGVTGLFSTRSSTTTQNDEVELDVSDIIEVNDVIEVETCDIEDITPSANNQNPFLLTKKSPISAEVEKIIIPLMIESDAVRAEVTAHLTQTLKQHGAKWRDHLPQTKSVLSETNCFLKITDDLGYSRDTEVMTVISMVEKGVSSEVFHDFAKLFPGEKKTLYAQLSLGELPEISRSSRNFLHSQGDYKASSYSNLIKELYMAKSNWRQKLDQITEAAEEITNKILVRKEITFAAHSESREIAEQAENITRLMSYPSNTQRIHDRQTLMDNFKKNDNWKAYSHELLSSLQLAHKLGFGKSHPAMKAVEQQVSRAFFLEAFDYLSKAPHMSLEARKFYFLQIISGKLTPDSVVIAARLLHSGRGEIVRTTQGGFIIRHKKSSKPQTRTKSGSHLSANTGGSGNQSGQQQRDSQQHGSPKRNAA
ncbi:MAG: hypothetical protein IPJ69_00490 [Deltaproteobacteria bacterium]|nr:MAG: hypothetical protein IPJ69_00490 [Deltaproteobacteria bacterium]